jgi:hypothetical protein
MPKKGDFPAVLYALLIVMPEFSHTVLSFLYWNINLPMSFRYLVSYALKAANLHDGCSRICSGLA